MRLVFPGGEHEPVDIAQGTTSVGSAPECDLVLNAAGVAARHAEIAIRPGGSGFVRALDPAHPTVLNGRQVTTEAPLKSGDLLLFGRVGCSIAIGDRRATPSPSAKASPAGAAPADDGRTRVRATLPRYMLHGVSGVTFGKTFAVTDNAVIGRQPDCDIAVPADEISRHHARLRVSADGVLVEDLGSANGSYINDKRISSGLLKPGEELRLDTVRFMLVTPGMDARQQSAPAARTEAHANEPAAKRSPLPWIVLAIVVLAAAAAAARYFNLM